MKLLILSLLVAYALCNCDPERCNCPKDPECKGSDLQCNGGTDSEGCPLQDWCMHVDPYAPCSYKAMCPVDCDEGWYLCKGHIDDQGCQKPDTCYPNGHGNPDGCPDVCDQICDTRTEDICLAGRDSKGCRRPNTCAPKDPPTGLMCPTKCPVYCNENEIMCPGDPTSYAIGCEDHVEDICITKDPDCPTHCPVYCGPNEDMCPGAVDSKGCREPDTCMPKDPKCGGSMCPVHCPEGHMQCARGTDPYGCRKRDTCVPIDENSPCPATCPLACDYGDLECPGQIDEKGCEHGAYCQHYEPTAICNKSCKDPSLWCSADEWVCPGKNDDRGCYEEGPCSAKGKSRIIFPFSNKQKFFISMDRSFPELNFSFSFQVNAQNKMDEPLLQLRFLIPFVNIKKEKKLANIKFSLP